MNVYDLKGPTAVVTGGGRGIGRAVIEILAEEGCRLLLAATNEALLEELADDLQGRPGTEARIFAADLRDSASQDALVALAGPEIDILVNNAGSVPCDGITSAI